MDTPKYELKVILLGDTEVGKTCFIHYYKTGKFLDDIPSTTGASFIKIKREFNNKKIALNFWIQLDKRNIGV